VLVLVRHGRTAQNAQRRLLGRLDVPLDPLGRRQAEALGRVPLIRDAARVIASPLQRARDTAAALGPPVVIDERWTEIDYGSYDGRALDDVPDLWQRWGQNVAFTPEGGESLVSVGARVRAACAELWDEAATSDVVVVSHVTPIKAAVAWALDVSDAVTWRLFLDVASVSTIGPGRGRSPVLRTYNETHHRPSA
jgi:alpha-ribazole phosphatase